MSSPHPFLASPILYVADVTPPVKWSHLIEVFKPCGFVRSGGKSISAEGCSKWAVIFTDVLSAEMALATLQGAIIPGLSPPFALSLSHSPLLETSLPLERLFRQFAKTSGSTYHKFNVATAQDIFTWFRPAGPLVSVQVDVNVGHARPACVLEYWDETHAQYARTNCRSMHPALADAQDLTLRTFDPRGLFCSKFGSAWTQADLRDAFSTYGDILDIHVKKVGEPDAFAFIFYKQPEHAALAMKALRGKVVGGKNLLLRYHEPLLQDVFRPVFPNNQADRQPDEGPWRRGSSQDVPTNGEPQVNPALDEARRRREDAEAAERTAQLEQEVAEAAEVAAQQKVAEAAQAYEAVRVQQREADAAVEEAERVLRAAKERQRAAALEAVRVLDAKHDAERHEHEASERRRAAEREAAASRLRREEAQRAEQDESAKAQAHPRGPRSAPASPTDRKGKEPEWRRQARQRQEDEAKSREAFDQRRRAWSESLNKLKREGSAEGASWAKANRSSASEAGPSGRAQNGFAGEEDRAHQPHPDMPVKEAEDAVHEEDGNAPDESWQAKVEQEEAERREEAEQMYAREREATQRDFEESEARRQEELQREQARRDEEDRRRQEEERAAIEEEMRLREEERTRQEEGARRRQEEERARREDEERRQQEERVAELRESIRKMKILNEQEEKERRVKEWQERVRKDTEDMERRKAEQRARQEAESKAIAEQQRKTQEQQERMAAETQRLRLYREAAMKERTRCQQRDALQWNIRPEHFSRLVWTHKTCIRRFQVLSNEFDDIKFSEGQPLTFDSVPWPILHFPPDLTFESIDWGAVEQFFAAARLELLESEYKKIVEKAHRRFHPDKWRSRGLLNTVLDEQLRKRLEDAGNIVAQAVTPLWHASKSP